VKPRPSVLLLLVGAALAGCGVGPGDEREGGGASLRVTRDFGQEVLVEASRPEVRSSDTVMRLLRAHADVETAYGGNFVQSLAGIEGGGAQGHHDWFYFVNGEEAGEGASDRALYPGDVVQWDYRDWQAAMSVPAIVGAFPEPFLHGSDGERIPTRVECADEKAAACGEVKDRLAEEGVTATGGALGAPAGEGLLRVVVGPWAAIRDLRGSSPLTQGPTASGIYARFAGDPAELQLLDQRGEVAALGSGVVAATGEHGGATTWFVTGVDEAGVEQAAGLLDEKTLRDSYAVAATAEGPVDLPVITRGP
jgi:uncharacterized protein DUF4430